MCPQKLGNYFGYTFYRVPFSFGSHLWWNLGGVQAGDAPWSADGPETSQSVENLLREHKMLNQKWKHRLFLNENNLAKNWTDDFNKFVKPCHMQKYPISKCKEKKKISFFPLLIRSEKSDSQNRGKIHDNLLIVFTYLGSCLWHYYSKYNIKM